MHRRPHGNHASATRCGLGVALLALGSGLSCGPGSTPAGLAPLSGQEGASPAQPQDQPGTAGRQPAPLSPGTLTVLDGSTGAPVAGAEVLVLPGPGEEEALVARLSAIDARLDAGATSHRSDASGRFEVPGDRLPCTVVARDAGRWGWVPDLAEPGAPRVLTLWPDDPLEVLVRDAGGRPVPGFPFELAWVEQREPVATGAGGVLHVPHAAELLDGAAGSQQTGWCSLRPRAALASGGSIRIDRQGLAEGPIELTLPATGRVEVLAPGLADLVDPSLFGVRLGTPPTRVAQVESFDADGRAVFEHVEVGLPLRIQLHVGRTASYPWFDFPADESAAAGGTRRIELPWQERCLAIAGRLLDETGAGLRSAEIAVGLVELDPSGGSVPGYRPTRTDAGGRFLLVLDAGRRSGPLELAAVHRQDGVGSRHAVLPVPGELPLGGAVELGDLRLGPSPLLAAGRVADAAGHGLPGAEIQVRASGAGGTYSGPLEPHLHWTSEAEGSFELYGVPTGPKLRLTAVHRERPELLDAESTPLDPGTRGVKLQLAPGGTLTGSLKLPEGLLPGDLTVMLSRTVLPEHAAGGRGYTYHQRLALQAGGTLRATGLRPGTYAVSIQPRGGAGALHRVGEVPVRGGEVTSDPRLQGIDLTSGFHLYRLTVAAPEEVGLPGAEVHLTGTAGGQPWRWRGYVKGDEVRVLSPLPTADLVARARGFRELRRGGVHGAVELLLEPGIPVRIRCRRDGRLPDSVQLLRRSDDSQGADLLRPFWAEASIDHGGEAHLRLPEPGRYEVHFATYPRWGSCGTPSSRRPEGDAEVTVLERDGGEQVFTFRVP